jgi:anti-anti-sigma factor
MSQKKDQTGRKSVCDQGATPVNTEQLRAVRIERSKEMVAVSFRVACIDEKNFVRIADELEEVIRIPTPQTVIIDLAGVHQIDELGLAVLQSVCESINEVGGKVAFSKPNSHVKLTMGQVRLAQEMNDRNSNRRPPQLTRW